MDVKEIEEMLYERQKTHGAFPEVALLVHKARNVFFDAFIACDPAQSLAFDMILLKLARISVGHCDNEDNWRDIAGYAVLGAGSIESKAEE